MRLLNHFMTTRLIPIGYKHALIRPEYLFLFYLLFLATPSFSEEQVNNTANGAPNMKNELVTSKDRNPEKSILKELGGQLLVDGSIRVLEPVYSKTLDLVEISTSVTPAVDHVRIYAVAVGTYTVIKAQFQNGTVIILGNN